MRRPGIDLDSGPLSCKNGIARTGVRERYPSEREPEMLLVKEFFGYKTMADFRKDWQQLSDQDKKDLRIGIENGTFTY